MSERIIKLSILLFLIFFVRFNAGADSPDAIAIRVIQNPSHYSAMRWYKEQGFSGSPQSLIVDGYEAVRDGRTVYVNASNIGGDNKLYTNIYLISYNQDAEQATADIFGQILSHWKFNNNQANSGFCSEIPLNAADCEGTAGCWHLDNDSKDSSGNNINGVNVNVNFEDHKGITNQAGLFGGHGNYIDMGNQGNAWPQSTIIAWIYVKQFNPLNENGNSWNAIAQINKYYRGEWKDAAFYVINKKLNAYTCGSGNTMLELNKWYQTAMVNDGATIKFYLNGKSDGFCATPPLWNDGWEFIRIGGGYVNDPESFNGLIDEVKIFKRALSADEIANNYNKSCLVDSDCQNSGYCQSPKAKITRDTRRLADLAEMKIALNNYKQDHGKYPELTSGTYLTDKTLSTWPSWQETLAKELSSGLPNDPINKLGNCAGYDTTTCWNQQQKKFADADANDPKLNLPADSHTYVYTSSNKGVTYSLCGVMESGLITDLNQGACPESPQTAQIGDTAENHPPVFAGDTLPTAESGRPYQGFIKAADPDNDALSWQFNIIDCPLWDKLRMENTAVPNQKAIKADHAGQAADCKFSVAVTDNRDGGQISKDFTIKVVNGHVPSIELIENKTVTIGKNLAFTIKAAEADSQYPLSFDFSGAPAGFNSTSVLDANEHDLNVSGVVVDTTKEYNATVIASDIYKGESAPVNFNINVINQPPAFTTAAPTNATACVNYSYAAHANDPDGHTVNYLDVSNSLPAGLTINQNTGLISGKPQNTGVFHIHIEARDQYYAQTDPQTNAKAGQSWDLNIAPENFTVNTPADSDVWVFANDGAGLYYNPGTGYPTIFNATASAGAAGHVVYALSDAAHPVPAASLYITPHFFITIDANGVIHGTPTDNAGDPGVHTVTVTATNDCHVAKNADFTITVHKNEWCGDGTCHSAALSTENCATCVADCACGGADVCFNGSCCTPATCAGNSAWCGSHNNGCGGTITCGSCGANASCSGGNCVCNNNFSACDGDMREADGCECNLSSNVCQNNTCTPYCAFNSSVFDNCVFP